MPTHPATGLVDLEGKPFGPGDQLTYRIGLAADLAPTVTFSGIVDPDNRDAPRLAITINKVVYDVGGLTYRRDPDGEWKRTGHWRAVTRRNLDGPGWDRRDPTEAALKAIHQRCATLAPECLAAHPDALDDPRLLGVASYDGVATELEDAAAIFARYEGLARRCVNGTVTLHPPGPDAPAVTRWVTPDRVSKLYDHYGLYGRQPAPVTGEVHYDGQRVGWVVAVKHSRNNGNGEPPLIVPIPMARPAETTR